MERFYLVLFLGLFLFPSFAFIGESQNEDITQIIGLIKSDSPKKSIYGYSLEEKYGAKTKDEVLNKLKELFSDKIDFNIQDENGLTPLMYASLYGKLEIVKLLINHGADINVENKEGLTALIISVKKRNYHIMNYLIGKGAKLESSKMSALTDAINNFDIPIVELLINKGADLKFTDGNGNAPVDFAKQKYELLRSILDGKEKPANPNPIGLDNIISEMTFEAIPLKDAMGYISKKYFAGKLIFDYKNVIDSIKNKNISINIRNKSIKEALAEIAAKANLSYEVDLKDKNKIIVKEK